MAAVRHLGLLGAYWDHPRRPLDGLHRYAKCGWNRCRNFDNMKLSIFCPFGLKTPIYASKNWGFRGILPQNGEQCQRSPQKAHLRVVTVLVVYYLCLSAIVPEKSRGNKKCDKKEEEERHIFGLFGIAVKWPWHGCMHLFWYLYVHSVEDSTLMPIFEKILLFFRFSGVAKNRP